MALQSVAKLKHETRRSLRSASALLLVVFGVLALRHGWMVDDAYISLRTIQNFFNGDGLVWNIGERVQVYTHPLWLMLCCVVYGITHEFFYSLIILGTLVSMGALVILSLRLARSELVAIVLLMAAMLSHAFVDYSTSGLENPLTHLLIGLSAWVYLGRVPDEKRFGLLCLLGGLALMTRPDNAVLLGPAVIAAGVQAYRRGTNPKALLRAMMLGGIPLFTWELFSLFYYGMLVPNTALAKLNSGIEAGELVRQGVFYLVATLDADPLTLVVILAGCIVPFVVRDRRMMPLALGIILHLLYLMKIGGDFMLGRFLTAPMFMALVCLSQVRRVNQTQLLVVGAVVVALGLSAHPNTFEINAKTQMTAAEARGNRRVTDERGFLADSASLMSASRTSEMPDHRWKIMGLRGTKSGRKTQIITAVGYRGFAGGPDIHWIDNVGLTDPLLSRLPARWRPNWMVGHFIRAIPAGYVETIESGENRIKNEGVRKLYDRIDIVTHGDLWSVERFKAIWWLNTGGPSRAIHEDSWRFHNPSRRSPASLREGRVPDGTPLDSELVRSFSHTGVFIQWSRRQHPEELELSVSNDMRFELRFYDGEEELVRVPVPRRMGWDIGGVTARHIVLPEVIQKEGFIRMRIIPRTHARTYGIGHLLFDEEIDDAHELIDPPEGTVAAKGSVKGRG